MTDKLNIFYSFNMLNQIFKLIKRYFKYKTKKCCHIKINKYLKIEILKTFKRLNLQLIAAWYT